MYWVCIIKDHRAKTLTISGTNRIIRIVDGPKVDMLAIELDNTFDIEDFGMDLADKMIQLLINKANNAEYYYDQVKDQHH